MFLSAAGVYCINIFFYHFPGNNYFPPRSWLIGLTLLLIYLGGLLQFEAESPLTFKLREVLYFYVVMSLLACLTTAVQFTPFPTIDAQIIAIENLFNINHIKIVEWTADHPAVNEILVLAYESLPLQMIYFPLLIILTGEYGLIREYYFLILLTALIGFMFYYFWPTTAPASNIDSALYGAAQRATGLKFYQIHHYIKPTTVEGGMVAFPSFHAIWAWLCLYLMRHWTLTLAILIPLNITLICSCVLLGWHYPSDILASFIILLFCHGVYLKLNKV